MPNVVLGVSGSIAAYRAADLARELMRAGCTVRVCLTDAAQQFVTKTLFESLTGQPCLQDAFEEPITGRMAHIDWARQADLLIVAPATANTLAKLANGVGDDMLTTLALAYEGPMLLAPAMNPAMYLQETAQAAIRELEERGAVLVDPSEGDVACGEHGQGKLASIARIADEALVLIGRGQKLKGKRVLITSGPTQELMDDVRYLTNRSSGRMGAALARAALLMGAEVTVVSGPVAVSLPRQASVRRVTSAREMLEASSALAAESDWIVGAAAVADYRPIEKIEGKRRRSDEPWSLKLVPNPDVLAELARASQGKARVIGFAAEPDDSLDQAREKLVRKGLAAIAVNDVSRADIGFESQSNELTLILDDGRVLQSGKRSKLACALWLFESLCAEPGS
ncbi:MAG: bifunctional phosphopantothenoylcysteine decarboxylase/phosphopantothenate--cysteine ligase CoaBC [Armatimonadetes bacterium]|nr:bifunctional phosphopantothenoylcysteine decarboxylase/phosphopantothenate--cysteine ligase CoaBC [Armatimonadota bacterium]